MAFEHRIPSELNPSGDLVVPLYIPHDPQWSGLLLGVLKTLEEPEYYERDPDYDDTSAQAVAGQWRDRTITPLIEAIATGGILSRVKFHTERRDIATNRTTTSTTNVTLGGTVLFTPTKENLFVRVSNILIYNSGDNATRVQPLLDGASGAQNSVGVLEGTTPHPMSCEAVFEGLTPGVEVTLQLYWRVDAGTGNCMEDSNHIWTIVEYDN